LVNSKLADQFITIDSHVRREGELKQELVKIESEVKKVQDELATLQKTLPADTKKNEAVVASENKWQFELKQGLEKSAHDIPDKALLEVIKKKVTQMDTACEQWCRANGY